MEKIAVSVRKKIFWGILAAELLAILVSGLLAADKVDWAYGILCCTPVGGILSVFYHPSDFFFGFTASAWFLSGIQFLMINYVVGQVSEVSHSKTELFLHSLAFTFFSGILVAWLVNSILLPVHNSLADCFFAASLLKKIIPLLLLIIYYAMALGCLYLTLKIFWDNVKMLGVVTLFGGGLLLIWRIAMALLAGGRYGGEYVSAMESFLTSIPQDHPFLAQFGFTILVSVVYNVGILLLHNAKANYEASMEEMDAYEKVEAMKEAVRYSRMSGWKKRRLLRRDPELVKRNLSMLEEQDVPTMEKEIDAYEYRKEIVSPGKEEETVSLASLVERMQRDYEHFCFRKHQRKMMRMSVKRFCKKWVPDRETLDRYGQELQKTEFAHDRLAYPEKGKRYGNVVLPTAIKCTFLLWVVTLHFLAHDDEAMIACAYYMFYFLYFPSAGFLVTFCVTALLYRIFRKDRTRSVFETKAFLPVLAVSLMFAILFSYRLTVMASIKHVAYAITICAVCPLFVICILMYFVPVKNFLRRRSYFAWKELRYMYHLADKQFDTVNTWKHRYGKHQVSAMICSQLRREEILNYWESKE